MARRILFASDNGNGDDGWRDSGVMPVEIDDLIEILENGAIVRKREPRLNLGSFLDIAENAWLTKVSVPIEASLRASMM